MMFMTAVERGPYADRIETLIDTLPRDQQLGAGRELLLCSDGELARVVARWEVETGTN